jgi:branched-subunit amino acid ABC-type transport system permease component
MKGALISLVIGIVLLLLIYFRLDVYYRTRSGIDIYFHDTYFIVSYASVVSFVLLILGLFFSAGGIIGTRFKSKLF